jgi:hypothetical protein
MFKSRIVRIAVASAITAVGMAASKGHAQEMDSVATSSPSRWEINLTSGKLLPTGTQRDAIKRAGLSAAQVSYWMHPNVAMTMALGWARSRDIATAGDPRLDLFSYDVGAELRTNVLQVSRTVSLRSFAGIGGGGRTYNYRSLDVDATHNLAAYGSVGGELGVKRVRLRVEARDYVTGFKPLNGAGASDTRNDVSVLFGLRIASH